MVGLMGTNGLFLAAPLVELMVARNASTRSWIWPASLGGGGGVVLMVVDGNQQTSWGVALEANWLRSRSGDLSLLGRPLLP